MLKNIGVSGLCLMLLTACDASSTAEKSKAVIGVSQTQVEQKISDTALYLPGGMGIDFGRAPISDKVLEDEVSKIRIVRYAFSESYDELDRAVASVIGKKGYVRTVNAPGDYKLTVTYAKQGSSRILARYARIKQKSDVETVLTLSWRF